MKYRIFVGFIFSGVFVLSFLYMHSLRELERREEQMTAMRTLVRGLQLTDLAIWTEARYTRHPSQSDLFSPFQDFPVEMRKKYDQLEIIRTWKFSRSGASLDS